MGHRSVRTFGLVAAFVLLAAGCDWAQSGFGPAGDSFNPYEPGLTVETPESGQREEHLSQHPTKTARELVDVCADLRTPAIANLVAPLRLTRREQEVCRLAARGLTNSAIADRLGVGVRTVEGHLLRATTKLGVTSRAEIAAALGDLQYRETAEQGAEGRSVGLTADPR